MRLNSGLVAALGASVLLGLASCASEQTTKDSNAEQDTLAREKQEKKAQEKATDEAALRAAATTTVERAKRDLKGIEKHFADAAGYVVFPTVTAGGLVIGAAHGNGVVYERRNVMPDRVIGTAEVSQATIGFQIGGQGFSEIIFFQDEGVLENFKKSNFEFKAEATGVAGGEGATAVAKYENGIAAYVFGEKGLMGSASIGTQKFKYKPTA